MQGNEASCILSTWYTTEAHPHPVNTIPLNHALKNVQNGKLHVISISHTHLGLCDYWLSVQNVPQIA
jgi:hypothetical protein